MVGVAGFEPAAPCSQSRCANQAAPHPGGAEPTPTAGRDRPRGLGRLHHLGGPVAGCRARQPARPRSARATSAASSPAAGRVRPRGLGRLPPPRWPRRRSALRRHRSARRLGGPVPCGRARATGVVRPRAGWTPAVTPGTISGRCRADRCPQAAPVRPNLRGGVAITSRAPSAAPTPASGSGP
jgi:hypothetical protein